MFKSRKKRQQQKEAALLEAKKSEIASEIETSKYKLLDDIHLAHDFRSSVILPQLNKDLDPTKLSKQQLHLAQLRDIPESPTTMISSPPLSPPPLNHDGTKQYQELAAWRHQRSQHRYSNGLFGGKQRGRPKPSQLRRYNDNEEDIQEYEEVDPYRQEVGEEEEVETPTTRSSATTTDTTNNELQTPPQSIIQQLHHQQEDEYSDIDQIEEDEDELLEELYEPGSDTEENFFFQDFSANPSNKPSNKKSTRNNRRKSRSNKVMSKFDLSSFARDLHDHRLSVVQRESRIIMTEDDEMELEKLLERQRQRMSMMTMVSESSESLVTPPPMPSLDLIKSHKQQATTINNRPITPTKDDHNTLEVPVMNSDHGSTTTDSSYEDQSNNSFACVKESSTVIKENDDDETIDVPQEILTPNKPVTSISSSNSTSSISIALKADQLKRSVSTTSIKSNNNVPIIRKRSNLTPIQDVEVKHNARKSVSMNDIHVNLEENEHSVTSAALDWFSKTDNHKDNTTIKPLQPSSDPTSLSYKKQLNPPPASAPLPAPQLSKSRSLFGSLRQVSRSKSHHHSGNGGGGIKGLVRNFSSHHKPSSTKDNSNSTDHDAAGMSRAAMAVIQHNVAKQEQKKAASVIPEESNNEPSIPVPTKPQRRSRSKSDAVNNNNLISHLISRAASSRKHNTTKVVNMEDEATTAAKKRAQVVRRTIIYVQPDSLHNLLKNGGDGSSIKVPPMPPKINTRNTMASSDGSLSPDDETVRSREYVTATKVVRQTSVRKRIVEDTTTESTKSSPLSESSTLLERQGSSNRKRYQLQSVDESELLRKNGSKHSSSSSGSSHNSQGDYMEGVELREMSDGSIVWGLVKKQGNRKSFFAPNQHNNGYEHIEDEEDDFIRKQQQNYRHNNSLSPPPIPKRSPRRQAPATDVYYSDQVTLPNLLKMMHGQQEHPGDDDEYEFHERAMSSVDDQLDEMMRILTSQQQQR